MCGIWCYCGTQEYSLDTVKQCVEQIKARGPEQTSYDLSGLTWGFGFTRLAINGLSHAADQPFSHQSLEWICNGEIYNHKELAERFNWTLASGSDCEIIGHMYNALDKNLVAWARCFDGVFAIAMYDKAAKKLILARDPYGVRPLYYGFIGQTLFAASEIKALPVDATGVQAFPPGHVAEYSPEIGLVFTKYHAIPWLKNPLYGPIIIEMGATYALKAALEAAVHKRLMTERPCAALLSGGLDSSLIAALVQTELLKQGKPPLETYSIGFAGSSDLKYARLVAEHIGSVHHEIVSTPDEFFAAIPEVIKAIESPDITTVRASVGNWLVAKYIKTHSPSQAKVVFNGDGSDEVFGSYLYFNNAPSDEAFEAEVERLLTDIHHFDVLRSDRSISSHGLEPRTPFLDKQFVALARSIGTKYLRPTPTQPEKWILRKAFEKTFFTKGLATLPLLPKEVLWRRKEAFSDGVSGTEKSWYEEIQERVAADGIELLSPYEMKRLYPILTPPTLEAYYYRQIYDDLYNHLVVPYYWMPRWSGETTDPSARTLKVYNAINCDKKLNP